MNAESIASALGSARHSGDRWFACCPLADEHTHGDANPSLSITERNGTILVRCHSRHAKEQERIIEALKARGLWPSRNGGVTQTWPRIVATYAYRNESGKVLFEVCRFDPKDFKHRRPDGRGGWIWNMDGVRRVLYRLPELLVADKSQPVFIVEGEKDANALAACGLVATTNAGGAGKWRSEYNSLFDSRDIAILPDNDQTGEDHVRHVARELLPIARRVRIVRLPDLPEKGDVSNWLMAGGTPEQLIKLVNQTSQLTPDSADCAPQEALLEPGNPWANAKSALDFIAESEAEVDYAVEDIIVRSGVTVCAAPRGLGKTHAAVAPPPAESFGGSDCRDPPACCIWIAIIRRLICAAE